VEREVVADGTCWKKHGGEKRTVCYTWHHEKGWIFFIYFTLMWLCIINFFVMKPNRCTDFTNLFCHETLHISDSSSVHHEEFIRCTLSNGICHTGL
jgi:hypothetical protein